MGPSVWKTILDKKRPAGENMEIDLGLFNNCDGPTLRVFGWSFPSITSGYFIDIEKELDTVRAASLGIEIAKRPTGGGIAFHMPGDISYSVTAPASSMPAGLMDSYLYISKMVAAALRNMGVDAKISSTDRSAGASNICFLEALPHEITVNGKKLVGSAIRRGKKTVLQQGTISVSRPREALSLIRGPFDREEYLRNSAALEELLPAPMMNGELPSLFCQEMIKSS